MSANILSTFVLNCTGHLDGHFCRKIYGSSRSSTCVPNV